MRKRVLYIILFYMIIVRPFLFLWPQRSVFLSHFPREYYARMYDGSQYVVGSGTKRAIGDDGLYAFAGYYYFFQNGDVSQVNFEHPPLGKYLIGLSIFLFNNENIINLLYALLLSVVTFRLAFIVLRNKLLALIPVAIITNTPLILDHFTYSLLDLPMILFVTSAVYFFLLGFDDSRYYYVSSHFWGAAFSTKFFPVLVLIALYFAGIAALKNKPHVLEYIASLFLIPAVYLLTHVSFFIYHPSFIEFLRHKKWMLAWFTGTPVIVGNIWMDVFTGRYIDATGGMRSNEYWNIFVPIMLLLAITPVRREQFAKKNKIWMTMYGFMMVYLGYITFLTGGTLRFMLPLYPVISVLAAYNAVLLFRSIMKKLHGIT